MSIEIIGGAVWPDQLRRLADILERHYGAGGGEVCEVTLTTNGATGKVDAVLAVEVEGSFSLFEHKKEEL